MEGTLNTCSRLKGRGEIIYIWKRAGHGTGLLTQEDKQNYLARNVGEIWKLTPPSSLLPLPLFQVTRFGPKVGQIGTKWNKLGNFKEKFKINSGDKVEINL